MGISIGFDAKRYFHNQTGLGNHSRNLIHSLLQVDPANHYVLFNAAGGDVAKEHDALSVESRKRWQPMWRQVGIVTRMEAMKLDVYHGLSAELPLFRPRKTKLVVTIHDLIFMKFPRYYTAVDRAIYTYKLKNAIAMADAIVCTSQHTHRDLHAIFPSQAKKMTVIYQGCEEVFKQRPDEQDLESFKRKYDLPDAFILCISKFEKRKNHLRLIEAYAKVRSQLNIPLVLVGKEGDTFEPVKKAIKMLDISTDVRLYTEVDQATLVRFVHASSWTVFPSEYEGFGIPVLESLMAGKPVLTCRQSSMEEIAGATGACMDPLNIHSIEEGLLNFTGNEVRTQSLAEGLSGLNRFEGSEIAQEHLKLYRQLTE